MELKLVYSSKWENGVKPLPALRVEVVTRNIIKEIEKKYGKGAADRKPWLVSAGLNRVITLYIKRGQL